MNAPADRSARAVLLKLKSGARLRVRVSGASRAVRLRDVSPDGLRVIERGTAARAPRLLPWDALERVDCRVPAPRNRRLALALVGALLFGAVGWAWDRRAPAGRADHLLPAGTMALGGAALGALAGATRRRWETVYLREEAAPAGRG